MANTVNLDTGLSEDTHHAFVVCLDNYASLKRQEQQLEASLARVKSDIRSIVTMSGRPVLRVGRFETTLSAPSEHRTFNADLVLNALMHSDIPRTVADGVIAAGYKVSIVQPILRINILKNFGL